MGRMAFVPEGQADSSQARSAWPGVWTFAESSEVAEVVSLARRVRRA
jgi:hypothetical protein